MKKLLIFFILMLLNVACPLFEDLSDPSSVVFLSEINNIPRQIDLVKIKISSNDSVYLDTVLYEKTFIYFFSIDDYKKTYPKEFNLDIEAVCKNNSVKFPLFTIQLDDCYSFRIDDATWFKNDSGYVRVFDNPNTQCGVIDNLFYSIGEMPQFGSRKCEIPLK